jgi:hypothetical protein
VCVTPGQILFSFFERNETAHYTTNIYISSYIPATEKGGKQLTCDVGFIAGLVHCLQE